MGEKWSSLFGLLAPAVISRMLESKGSGVKGNFKGEGRLMGGLLILAPGDEAGSDSSAGSSGAAAAADAEEKKGASAAAAGGAGAGAGGVPAGSVVFQYQERFFGDHADAKELLAAAVKGLPKVGGFFGCVMFIFFFFPSLFSLVNFYPHDCIILQASK